MTDRPCGRSFRPPARKPFREPQVRVWSQGLPGAASPETDRLRDALALQNRTLAQIRDLPEELAHGGQASK